MATLRYHLLDVFTDRRYAGNPLAVVEDADALGPAQMQAIAREFNLSETVFLLAPRSDAVLRRVRIFTPARELPFAGHPTVGTACLLAELGIAPPGDAVRFALEEGVGPVPVQVRRGGAATWAELRTAQLPEYGPAPDAAAIAAGLGLAPDDLGRQGETLRSVSCGVPFVLVPLRAPELLAALAPDMAALARTLAGQWAGAVYVYAHGYEGELRARMFAPDMGIAEDPATGSAAAALAGALGSEAPAGDTELRWTLHQGVEMGRPSRIDLAVERSGGRVSAVRVGGHAVRLAQGELQV